MWFILFSKIVSVIFDSPLAIVISAVNGACKSVGKPGKGAVFIFTEFSFLGLIVIELPLIMILLPLSWSLFVTDSRWLGITGEIVIDEDVAAAAIRKVPASIRSGITYEYNHQVY